MTTKRISCFIRKNTPELRAKLEELGYINHKVYVRDDYYDYLQCERIFYHQIKSYYELLSDAIDCGTNEKMFLALCALRDDSDYMQWFIDGENWFLCQLDCVEWEYGDGAGFYAHKATPEEIIEHFKTK